MEVANVCTCACRYSTGGDEDAKMNGAVNHVGEKKKSTNKRRTEREKGLK